MNEVVDPALPQCRMPPAVHPECGACCARHACHYCAGTAAGSYWAIWRGHVYWACAIHREMFKESLATGKGDGAIVPQVVSISPLLR